MKPGLFSTTAFTLLLTSTAFAAPIKQDPCDAAPRPEGGAPTCVTVTAYRSAQPLDRVGSSVTVITRDDMERRGDRSAADALKRVPGVTLSRNGGIGGTSQIRVRGSDPGQVKVLIDGMPVNDPASSDAAFDFATLLTPDITRIEVLRGPQSALYGSDAIGGVINIITGGRGARKGWNGFAEAGKYKTFHEGLGYNGGTDDFYYGASVQHFQNEGFSRISAGNEKDGARIADFKASMGGQPMENVALDFSGGYSDADIDFDPSPTADGPAYQDRRLGFGVGQAVVDLLDNQLHNTFKAGATRTERDFNEPLSSTRFSTFHGTRTQASYQADLDLRARDVATAGIEWQNDDSKTTSTNLAGVRSIGVNRDISSTALYAHYLLGITDGWTLTAGGRHDDHSQFGSANTYRFTTAYAIPATATTLRASVGTGFKAPTLFQLYSNFGTPTLRPEESTGYDLGVEQRFWGDRVAASVTGFRNEFENLIIFDTGTSRYRNVNRATTKGIESTVNFTPSPYLLLSATHTYMLSEDDATHRALQRRPKHAVTLGADADITDEARIGAQWRFIGRQWDTSSGNRIVQSYSVLDVTGSYDIDPHLTLTGRIDNVFDRRYQEAARYNASGIAGYIGVKVNY